MESWKKFLKEARNRGCDLDEVQDSPGFGQGTAPGGEWYEKRVIVVEDDEVDLDERLDEAVKGTEVEHKTKKNDKGKPLRGFRVGGYQKDDKWTIRWRPLQPRKETKELNPHQTASKIRSVK
jgi:hypothetical protein